MPGPLADGKVRHVASIMNVSSPDNRPDDRLDAMTAALRAYFERAAPFREDRALAGELCEEAGPVLRAFAHAPDDPAGFHEAFTLLNLLGRRAALLGATPSAGLGLARALLAALETGGCAAVRPEQIEMACVEGFCSGRDEHLREHALKALLAQQLEFAIAPACHAIVLCGAPPNEQLERWLDEAMRILFRRETRCAIVDATRLGGDGELISRTLASALITAASLGVSLALVSRDPVLLGFVDVLAQRGQLTAHDSFANALAQGLRIAGHTRRKSWPEALGFGRRRTDRDDR